MSLELEAEEDPQRARAEAQSTDAAGAEAQAVVPEPLSCPCGLEEVAAPMAMLQPVETATAEAPLPMSGVRGAVRWGRRLLGDGGGWVCLAWACPRTCRVGRTLPTLGGPEKPCDDEWSNRTARRLDCPS